MWQSWIWLGMVRKGYQVDGQDIKIYSRDFSSVYLQGPIETPPSTYQVASLWIRVVVVDGFWIDFWQSRYSYCMMRFMSYRCLEVEMGEKWFGKVAGRDFGWWWSSRSSPGISCFFKGIRLRVWCSGICLSLWWILDVRKLKWERDGLGG
jgi:hypothetical protein